ncbi:MAG: response regulator, partial [Steroidobacteraceae bacterium]
MDHRVPPREQISRRVLVACADKPVRDRITAHLRECEIEVFLAEDDRVAITQFGRQSFPVLICDRMLGSVAGTELIRQVRCISIEPVYVLMMSDESTAEEINSVYCAGVDQFMQRGLSASVLKDRVQAAFKAISLRRISRIIGHREIVTVDLASGAHTARHLVGRLGAEIELAHATAGTLEIAIIRIGSAHGDSTLPEDLLAVLEAVQMSLRPRFDWVAWLHPTGHCHRLAVVMPNAGRGGAAALEQHVRNAFALDTFYRHLP